LHVHEQLLGVPAKGAAQVSIHAQRQRNLVLLAPAAAAAANKQRSSEMAYWPILPILLGEMTVM
jgi:hypothetical protein